jgi:epoxyqueuosine reductase
VTTNLTSSDLTELAEWIKQRAEHYGFQQAGIANCDVDDDADHLAEWLKLGYQGSMSWLQKHAELRRNPAQLHPGTARVISLRMNYLSDTIDNSIATLDHDSKAYISRYALGRDYHKLIRKRLQQLSSEIEERIGPFGYRGFVDSAPVLEKALARNTGIGWLGKHTLLLNREAGSWFFLGEIYTDLALPVDKAYGGKHCGSCTSCIDVCPTQAIVAPMKLDARRCISYLTIENKGSIPVEFRKPMGNRVFGCDDCQLFCPWNKYAKPSGEVDFQPRHQLDSTDLATLFAWTEEEFDTNTQGMAIRRPGYQGWLRNLAVGLGNADTSTDVIDALSARRGDAGEMLAEHIDWALAQHSQTTKGPH